jgi:hypothetical protein
MPEIPGILKDFVNGKTWDLIYPIPPARPDQRGPSCGFYALAYAMLCWYSRQKELGENWSISKPLAARTSNVDSPSKTKSLAEKTAKFTKAKTGQYDSLRQYGKLNQLTAYGSVFNAENLVKIARGAGSQYGGQFDGEVLDISNASDFERKVEALIKASCPVIVPFDVCVTDPNVGDPTNATGKAAHWTVIIGTYEDSGVVYAIHRHWGAFRYSLMSAFAASNAQLTANAFVELKKCEVRNPNDAKFLDRDFLTQESIEAYQKLGFTVKELSGAVTNYEFCKPKSVADLKKQKELQTNFPDLATRLAEDKLSANGFDPKHLANAGLKDKIVAVYPVAERDGILKALPK